MLWTAVPVVAQPPAALDARSARIEADATRGAKVKLTGEGGVVFSGHQFSESSATVGVTCGADRVFETRFVFTRPQGFYAHMLYLSPRVTGAGAYRISYRFVGASPVSWNNTGFYLTNTASEAYKTNQLDPTPLAGAPYRLTYGREYVACAAVRDVPGGVNIRFYLHDTTVQDDDLVPLFECTDTRPDRLAGSASDQVQVGCGGLVHPASPVWFGAMWAYGWDHLGARRERSDAPIAPTADLVAPVPTQRTELPNVFGDNMVLQRRKPIAVWGRGIDGDRVTVTLAGRSRTARVAGGRWRVNLPAVRAGGPFELVVKGRDRTLTVKDVLIGEVWVLGGQSNMGFWLSVTSEAATEVPRSDCPTIRIFQGWHPSASEPQFDVDGGAWHAISPALEGHYSAIGYYFARELQKRYGVPIALLDVSTPATGIECWLSAKAAESVYGEDLYEVPGRYPPGVQDPASYYNGKVAPVMPSSVAGIIWYQGDGSDAATGLAYRRRLAALIPDWRAGFGQGDLPFLVVQIPQFEGCSPEMRETQCLAALGAKRVGLAVTLDTGDPKDIHPKQKRPVAERLALLARQIAYREPIEGFGPIYRSLVVRGGKVYLTFDHAGGGLELRGAGGFEVCGPDGKYEKASAQVVGRNQLDVWSERVPRPVAVRYAWAPVPEISLYNKEGLLASPFRTSRE